MKPDDRNAALSPDKRPFRILIISGSDRRQYNCPGVDSKSRTLMLQMAEMLPQDWEIDYEDLGNVYARARIQSCNACVSTSMALCVWPCNCYEKDSKKEPDLMWDLDMYSRLDMADAWAIIGPVNWYAPTSNLKLMFDRLVCMNGGNPDEKTIDHKNPEKAMALEHAPEWETMSLNHLEGRTAGFFCYGDEGGDEMDETGRPKLLRHKYYFDPEQEPFKDMRDAYAPLVWQCRYGGVEVPDDLWAYCTNGKDRKYSENQAEDMVQEDAFMASFFRWVQRFETFVRLKGKVSPNQYRAYGFEPPAHHWADVQDGLRYVRMMVGKPPEGSSSQIQEELGLNQDATLHTKKGEGEKLREKE
ncbi:NAD(P)H-dependent oxidoreductase [Rufibacter hautae]|uniref:Flavodoxin family protein n=1 Tax=Rufibacter hautae TaxID=2595005 RepID=A0A5B6TBF4_9BACT|nr:NAD(P)H-dependent oxidoreductase [Rufibacter hautae]KAA3436930.1 flavodoxin family protein [Rufibacter hautae]